MRIYGTQYFCVYFISGSQGPQGIQGINGAPGPAGGTGGTGGTGGPGSRGLQGNIGATGASGAPGVGSAGPPGPPGSGGGTVGTEYMIFLNYFFLNNGSCRGSAIGKDPILSVNIFSCWVSRFYTKSNFFILPFYKRCMAKAWHGCGTVGKYIIEVFCTISHLSTCNHQVSGD